MNDYISSCIEFLQKTGSAIQLPEQRKLDLSENRMDVKWGLVDSIQLNNIPMPGILKISVFFMVLDSYFESINPAIEGFTFRKKYQALPQSTNLDKMIAQIYRILKVYRNATVHNMSSITMSSNSLTIKYTFASTTFDLEITMKGIAVIESFILCYLLYQKLEYSSRYKEYLFYAYYQDVLNEIGKFNDEEGGLVSVSSTRICRHVRYDCHTVNYAVTANKMQFDYPDCYLNNPLEPIDINISYGQKEYVIPIEVVDSLKEIDVSELSFWEKSVYQ